MIEELTLRDWAGCVVTDDPEIHALPSCMAQEPRTLGGWIDDTITRLERLLGASSDKRAGAGR